MDYCVPLGIPHSVFLQWHPDDQDKALAWLREKARHCPSCGTVPDEWIDEEGRIRAESPYQVDSIRCAGCETLAEHQSQTPEGRKYNWGWKRTKR